MNSLLNIARMQQMRIPEQIRDDLYNAIYTTLFHHIQWLIARNTFKNNYNEQTKTNKHKHG